MFLNWTRGPGLSKKLFFRWMLKPNQICRPAHHPSTALQYQGTTVRGTHFWQSFSCFTSTKFKNLATCTCGGISMHRPVQIVKRILISSNGHPLSLMPMPLKQCFLLADFRSLVLYYTKNIVLKRTPVHLNVQDSRWWLGLYAFVAGRQILKK